MKIEKQTHHGTEVWTHVAMDVLRATECLCKNCVTPGCPVAAGLFRACRDNSIALAVTRCPDWEAM